MATKAGENTPVVGFGWQTIENHPKSSKPVFSSPNSSQLPTARCRAHGQGTKTSLFKDFFSFGERRELWTKRDVWMVWGWGLLWKEECHVVLFFWKVLLGGGWFVWWLFSCFLWFWMVFAVYSRCFCCFIIHYCLPPSQGPFQGILVKGLLGISLKPARTRRNQLNLSCPPTSHESCSLFITASLQNQLSLYVLK